MYNINDPEDRLTMAIFEFIDYTKEYSPLTLANVDAYERGVARYLEKIEIAYQNYYEKSSDDKKEKEGVARMIDAITKGAGINIRSVRKSKPI